MDSTKTNLLEKQPSSEFPKPSTLKLYVLSLVIFLSLVIAGVLFITTIINLRDSPGPRTIHVINLSPTPVQSIRAVCSFVVYKRLCHNTLSSSMSSNISSDNSTLLSLDYVFSAENIIFHFFQLSVNQLIGLANISESNDTIPELRECQYLLNQEINVLNNSVATSQDLDAFRQEVNDYLDRFKRMETNQQACLDKLRGRTGSSQIDEIRLKVHKMRRHVRNSRAVLLNIDPIITKIYDSSSSVQVTDDNSIHSYGYFFHGMGYDYMIIFLLQYVFLLFLLILMLKL